MANRRKTAWVENGYMASGPSDVGASWFDDVALGKGICIMNSVIRLDGRIGGFDAASSPRRNSIEVAVVMTV
jgi:hypothetical protein